MLGQRSLIILCIPGNNNALKIDTMAIAYIVLIIMMDNFPYLLQYIMFLLSSWPFVIKTGAASVGFPAKPTSVHLSFSNSIPLLGQWFSNGANFAPRGCLTMSGNIGVVTTGMGDYQY